jgi:hypothetical protein
MPRPGCQQVRFNTQLVKIFGVVEPRPERRVRVRSVVDLSKNVASQLSLFYATGAGKELVLPVRELFSEELHGKISQLVIDEKDPRHDTGHNAAHMFEIGLLGSIPPNIGDPFIFDFQLGQRALDDQLSFAILDEIDLARDATGEWSRPGGLADEVTATPQQFQKLSRLAHISKSYTLWCLPGARPAMY